MIKIVNISDNLKSRIVFYFSDEIHLYHFKEKLIKLQWYNWDNLYTAICGYHGDLYV
jgi:hypothetical protein